MLFPPSRTHDSFILLLFTTLEHWFRSFIFVALALAFALLHLDSALAPTPTSSGCLLGADYGLDWEARGKKKERKKKRE
jgi:hypothetical protein